ncbi:unnamed protein product [Heterobilharzia americana]|nr:unnamed protein product [Heterobilharzia americana]
MPLIMLCGYPCSGKSTIAALLAESLKRILTDSSVIIVDEFKSNNIESGKTGYDIRCDVYSDSQREREFRGQHKSEVERALTRSQSTVVIMDAPNYIKGYRYELYCLAKSYKHQHIVLLSDVPAETSKEWNSKINRYPDGLLSDMISRFERPQSTQRWDNPLIIMEPHYWGSPTLICMESVISQLKQLLINVTKKIKPNKSTQPTVVSSSNYLQNLEYVTQQIVDHILHKQALGSLSINLPERFYSAHNQDIALKIKNPDTIYTEGSLARLKRRYIAVQRLKFDQFNKIPDNASIAANFIQFISLSGDADSNETN